MYRYCTSPGFVGTLNAITRNIDLSLHSETVAESLESTRPAETIIEQVDPDLCIIDTLFDQAYDAASRLKRAIVILSPNTLQDAALPAQGLNVFRFPWSVCGPASGWLTGTAQMSVGAFPCPGISSRSTPSCFFPLGYGSTCSRARCPA